MTAVLEGVGVYSLTELSRRTTVPRATLELWIRRGWLPVVKIDGVRRTTIHAARLAAEEAAQDGRGKPRGWKLEPADTDESVRVPAR